MNFGIPAIVLRPIGWHEKLFDFTLKFLKNLPDLSETAFRGPTYILIKLKGQVSTDSETFGMVK